MNLLAFALVVGLQSEASPRLDYAEGDGKELLVLWRSEGKRYAQFGPIPFAVRGAAVIDARRVLLLGEEPAGQALLETWTLRPPRNLPSEEEIRPLASRRLVVDIGLGLVPIRAVRNPVLRDHAFVQVEPTMDLYDVEWVGERTYWRLRFVAKLRTLVPHEPRLAESWHEFRLFEHQSGGYALRFDMYDSEFCAMRLAKPSLVLADLDGDGWLDASGSIESWSEWWEEPRLEISGLWR